MIFSSVLSKTKFLVCYGKFDITQVMGYDLLIVESANFNYAEVAYLKKYNKKVVAYISLGEINEHAKDFKLFKNTVSEKNSEWNSYYLDIASPKTVNILNSMIKNIYYMGYDGLFLDNIDNYTTYGFQNKLRNNLVEFVTTIKNKFPDKILVQNAGLELVPNLYNKIDYVLMESIFTNYNFEEKKYQIRDKATMNERLSLFKQQIKKYNIKPLLIEYAVDNSMIKNLKKLMVKDKIPCMTANIDLQNIPEQ